MKFMTLGIGVAVALSGCKASLQQSQVVDAAATGQETTVDFATLDYSQGIIMALMPKPGDPDYPTESTEVAPTVDQIAALTTEPTSVPSDGTSPDLAFPANEQTAFALAGHQFLADVVIGSEVFHDLLRAAANQSVTGQTQQMSVNKIRATAHQIASEVRPLLEAADASVNVRFFYSRDYLANLVRRTYIDPRVYSYRGPFHRIVHRRYSRGRGIVWRKVHQILYSELNKFEGIAQRELMALSSDRLTLRLYRAANATCGTTQPSYVRVFHNNKIVGRAVTYTEMKSTVQQAQGLISQVSQAVPQQ